MATYAESVEDKFEIIPPFKNVQIRRATIIKKDGEEISRTYFRRAVDPDQEISVAKLGELYSDDLKTITDELWTQAVKDAYAAHKAQFNSVPDDYPG